MYCHEKSKIPMFFKISTSICLSCITLSSIGDLSHMTIAYVMKLDPSDTAKLFGIILFADVVYFMSSVSLYLYILGKSYYAFKQTVYSVSKCYIIFVLSLILILSLSMAVYLYFVSSLSGLEFYKRSEILLITMICSDILIDISLLILFISKLQKLLYDTLITDYIFINLSNAQRRLISLITKQSILGIFIIVFNSLFFVCTTIIALHDIHGKINDKHRLSIEFSITYCVRALENTIIITMVYLNFDFNTKIYIKLCSYLHKGCYGCCLCCIRQKLYHGRNRAIKSITTYQI